MPIGIPNGADFREVETYLELRERTSAELRRLNDARRAEADAARVREVRERAWRAWKRERELQLAVLRGEMIW